MYMAQDYFSCCDQGIIYLSMFDVLVECLVICPFAEQIMVPSEIL